MSTIPSSELVNVTPSVLATGGAGVDVIGLVLTTSTRVPIGTVASFPSLLAVQNFFGGGSNEAAIAANYFAGFEGAQQTPGALLFAQYNQSAVAAYTRGGKISAVPLATLQGYSGSLNIVVDGYPRNAGSVNLSAASSFSSAAGIIQTALNAADPTEANVTASFGATFTGTQAGTNLTTSAVVGLISVGDTIAGTGVAASTTIVSQTSGTPGGAGVYVTNLAGTASSANCTAASNVLDVTNLASGTIAVGQYVTGSGVVSAVILAQLTGPAGGVGTYTVSGSPQQVAGESMVLQGTPVAVTYDSQSGAFVITSGITGVPSSVAFATGTIAASLLLTSATGAVLSQGAAAAVPAAFMNALTQVNNNWVCFMTAFDPDNGSGNTVKLAFDAWNDTQDDLFAYVCWDTDVTPANTVPATGSLGYILNNTVSSSGTCLVWAATNTLGIALAAFVMGAAASIDFEQINGRITFAFKAGAGITATVSDPTTANNLAGAPLTAGSEGNGYNFYGAYAQAGQSNIWFQRGFVTGPFAWIDSYVNQIVMNSQLSAALLSLFGSARSIPFTTSGANLIEQALLPVIEKFLDFGAFGPGTLTSAQAAQINQDAGSNIAGTIAAQGWYVQVVPASAAVEASRGPQQVNFWYLDNGSVQSISLSSVAVIG